MSAPDASPSGPRRPVLITVDDDPSVSRAVARDLRRRYGERPPDRPGRLRGRGAGGDQGTGAARRSGRGHPGRLPDARDERRRVPRGGDGSGAAGPPGPAHRVRRHQRRDRRDQRRRRRPLSAQALGTAGGEALPGGRRTARRSGSARAAPAEHKIKILGHPWSQPSYEVRDFLARNLVPYRWYNVEEPDGERLLAAAGAEAGQVPVVITADGTPLIQPSLVELADAVGLSTQPQAELYDVVIVGGGPAGLGAGGVRRLRGSEDGDRRARRGRRAGRPELADRELPGLPRRRGRRPAHRPGPAAGAAVRRRAADRPDRHRPGGQGPGPRR